MYSHCLKIKSVAKIPFLSQMKISFEINLNPLHVEHQDFNKLKSTPLFVIFLWLHTCITKSRSKKKKFCSAKHSKGQVWIFWHFENQITNVIKNRGKSQFLPLCLQIVLKDTAKMEENASSVMTSHCASKFHWQLTCAWGWKKLLLKQVVCSPGIEMIFSRSVFLKVTVSLHYFYLHLVS